MHYPFPPPVLMNDSPRKGGFLWNSIHSPGGRGEALEAYKWTSMEGFRALRSNRLDANPCPPTHYSYGIVTPSVSVLLTVKQ